MIGGASRRRSRPSHRLRRMAYARRLDRLVRQAETASSRRGLLDPPPPPLELTPLVAASPETDPEVLWHIARTAPELRRWLVANPRADAALLEHVSQAGGPGVRRALTVLLTSLDARERRAPTPTAV